MFFGFSDVFGHANDIFSPCPEQPHVPFAQILGQLSRRLGNFVEPDANGKINGMKCVYSGDVPGILMA